MIDVRVADANRRTIISKNIQIALQFLRNQWLDQVYTGFRASPTERLFSEGGNQLMSHINHRSIRLHDDDALPDHYHV